MVRAIREDRAFVAAWFGGYNFVPPAGFRFVLCHQRPFDIMYETAKGNGLG